jgi:hypothetical protein
VVVVVVILLSKMPMATSIVALCIYVSNIVIVIFPWKFVIRDGFDSGIGLFCKRPCNRLLKTKVHHALCSRVQ